MTLLHNMQEHRDAGRLASLPSVFYRQARMKHGLLGVSVWTNVFCLSSINSWILSFLCSCFYVNRIWKLMGQSLAYGITLYTSKTRVQAVVHPPWIQKPWAESIQVRIKEYQWVHKNGDLSRQKLKTKYVHVRVHSHWANNFATKFLTEFTTKYLWLSNFQT